MMDIMHSHHSWLDFTFHLSLKGLVHPKMKIMSLMTHPHGVPSP